MEHRFLTPAEIDMLLDPSRWRVAVPGQPQLSTPSKSPRVGKDEAAWRHRSRHAHAHAELLVVLRGSGAFALGDTLLDAREGLIALVPPDLMHDDGLPPGSDACHLWLVWLDDRVLVVLAEAGGRRTRPVQSLLAAACGPDPALLLQAVRDGADQRIRSALALTLAQVVELGWRPAPAAGRLRAEVFDAMRRHLERSGGAGASLYTLAQQARVSRGYFARAFRQATGSAVGAFIDLCRLRRAEALRQEGHTEGEIARALGFSNPQSWARWRRKKVPPS